MSNWERHWKPSRDHINRLRDKYVKGTATPEEVDAFWAEALKDGEQLELLKTELDLKEMFQRRRN